jgi:hypothetical protein
MCFVDGATRCNEGGGSHMKTYLRFINPIVAIIVLLLCIWAAIFDEGKFEPGSIIFGTFPTYFFAKGLFCSSALFILGKILLEMILRREESAKLELVDDKDEGTETT